MDCKFDVESQCGYFAELNSLSDCWCIQNNSFAKS